MTTETKDKDAKQIRAWAEQEKRKADLPGYGAAYRKAVEREAQRQIESVAKTAVVEAKPPGEGGIQLKSGEWVDKAEFEKLSPEDQSLLNELGTRGFRDYYAQKEAEFKAANVELKTGGWVSKEMYDALSAEDKELLNRLGVEKFNKQKQAEFESFKKDNVQLKTGEWIKKEDYNKLPTDWQSEISRRGVEGFQSWLKTAYGGATEYVIADIGGAQQVFGVTPDPNIGLDAGGNRVWIGGRWPDAVKKTKTEIIGSGIPGRWPAEVKEFIPTTPPASLKEPTYTGLPTVLGGTWGMTPETLAVQKLGGEVITYPRGITRAEAQRLTEQAIKQLSPVERERYEAEVAAIESMPGETIKEKLAAREQVRASEAKLARQSARYEAIGGKLVRAQLGGKETLAVELKTGELIPQEEFDNLSKERQKLAIEKGREAIYVRTAKGEWIDKEWFEELTPGEQKRLLEEGIRGLEDLWAANETAFKMDNMQLPSGEWVNKQEFNALPSQLQEVVRKEGLKAIDISGLKPEEQFKKMQEWKLIDETAKYGGVDKETGEILLEDGRPWHEKYLTAEMAKGLAIGMIPIAGTWYHWNTMSNWERGLSIAFDVMTFIPYVNAVSAGVRAGKPIVAAVGRAALAEAKAPIIAVTHPVATVKTMVSPVKTLIMPKRVPIAAAEVRSYILRYPAEAIGDAKDAMHARDLLMTQVAKGNKPAIQYAGKQIELADVAIQQRGTGMLVHNAPDITPFLYGSKLQKGPEGVGMYLTSSVNTGLTHASAFGKGFIPAPDVGTWEWTGRHIRRVGEYRPDELIKLDLPATRRFNLADATNIPEDLAKPLESYIRQNKGLVYGSFNEWLKVKGAPRPHDIDIAFANQKRAMNDILDIAQKAGYKARLGEHSVEILLKGKWTQLGDIADMRQHTTMLRGYEAAPPSVIDGIRVERIGEQYLKQGYGAIEKTAKASERQKHLLKMSGKIEDLIREAGYTKRMRGSLLIRDEKILSQWQPSGKLFRGDAEIEATLQAGLYLPPVSQILKSTDAAGETIYFGVIGKPFTPAEIAKMKLMGSVDTIRDIFRPAIKIDGVAVKAMDELHGLAAEARELEAEIEIAKAAKDTAKATRLEAELSALNSRARAVARRVDAAYAARAPLRPVMMATGDYIDRISYNELARNKPAELARILRDVPKADRERLLGEVEPKYRAKVQKEIEKLPARAPREEPEVPRGLTPVVPRVGLPRAEVPGVPEVTRAPGVPRAPLGVPGVTVPTGVAVPKIPPRVQPGETPPKTTPPVLPPGAATKFEDLTEEQKAGSIAWKQGWCYHLIYPPYGEKEILHSAEPFPGVRIHKGEGAAYKSPVREKGEVPHTVERDLGIVDIKFTTPKKYSFIAGGEEQVKYPKVHYRPDPKQKTKVTSAIGSIITEGK